MDPFNPGAMPDGTDPNAPQEQKPWEKLPQPQPNPDNGANGNPPVVDGVSAGADATDFAGEVAGGAMEAAGVVEGVAGGCAEGCGGCSIAILFLLFATAGTAMALFR